MKSIRSLLFGFCKKKEPEALSQTIDPEEKYPIKSLKPLWMFAPSVFLLPVSNIFILSLQPTITPLVTASLVIPSIGLTRLSKHYPYENQSYNIFYRRWGIITSLSCLATIAFPFYPYIQNGMLLGINILTTLIDYYLRIEQAEQQKQVLTDKIPSKLSKDSKQYTQYKAQQIPKKYKLERSSIFLLVSRIGLIGLIIMNIYLVHLADYVIPKRMEIQKQQMKKYQGFGVQ